MNNKLSLTEATMLALQGKLELNETKKLPRRQAKKTEDINVSVDDNNNTIVETDDATVIVTDKQDPIAIPEESLATDVVEVPVEGDETIIPEQELTPEQIDEIVEEPLDESKKSKVFANESDLEKWAKDNKIDTYESHKSKDGVVLIYDETTTENKITENIEIEVSEDGKEVDVEVDEGEVVEVKDETPDDVERPNVVTDEPTEEIEEPDVDNIDTIETTETKEDIDDEIFEESYLVQCKGTRSWKTTFEAKTRAEAKAKLKECIVLENKNIYRIVRNSKKIENKNLVESKEVYKITQSDSGVPKTELVEIIGETSDKVKVKSIIDGYEFEYDKDFFNKNKSIANESDINNYKFNLNESKADSLSFEEFKKVMQDAYDKDKTLEGVIVFTEDSFNKPYSEEERSYKVSNNTSRGLQTGKISNSIWGDCLDGKDLGVRLDIYMQEDPVWKVDYCYILDKNTDEKKTEAVTPDKEYMGVKYFDNKDGYCPVCNSQLYYEAVEHVDADMEYYPWQCEKCGTRGEAWFKELFQGHTVITSDDEDNIDLPFNENEKIEESANLVQPETNCDTSVVTKVTENTKTIEPKYKVKLEAARRNRLNKKLNESKKHHYSKNDIKIFNEKIK